MTVSLLAHNLLCIVKLDLYSSTSDLLMVILMIESVPLFMRWDSGTVANTPVSDDVDLNKTWFYRIILWDNDSLDLATTGNYFDVAHYIHHHQLTSFHTIDYNLVLSNVESWFNFTQPILDLEHNINSFTTGIAQTILAQAITSPPLLKMMPVSIINGNSSTYVAKLLDYRFLSALEIHTGITTKTWPPHRPSVPHSPHQRQHPVELHQDV